MPGSTLAVPDKLAIDVVPAADMTSEPVRLPVAVGLKATATVQDAENARVPPHTAMPVGVELRTKSPVVVGWETETAVPDVTRFVSVNCCGPLPLWTGTVPKSCASGVRISPLIGRPVPVSPRM